MLENLLMKHILQNMTQYVALDTGALTHLSCKQNKADLEKNMLSVVTYGIVILKS